jgi:hypothetical protein
VFSATRTATQASLPSRAAVRWHLLAVIILGVALAAVTAVAVYLAGNDSTAAAARPLGDLPARTPTGRDRVALRRLGLDLGAGREVGSVWLWDEIACGGWSRPRC